MQNMIFIKRINYYLNLIKIYPNYSKRYLQIIHKIKLYNKVKIPFLKNKYCKNCFLFLNKKTCYIMKTNSKTLNFKVCKICNKKYKIL